MSLFSWLWRSETRRCREPYRARLQVECLETREVLSGNGLTDIVGPASVAEGGVYTLALNVADTPVLEWRIDWGDGNVETLPGSAQSATHDYEDGAFDFTISVEAQHDVAFLFYQWSTAAGGNGHYYALTSSPASWTAAEAEAVALGGHLVSITSQAEQTFIQQTFLSGADARNIYWLGLTDFANEKTFVWSDGETFNFKNWQGPNEPNNFGGNEDFVTINWHYANGRVGSTLGTWNDSPLNGIDSALNAPAPVRGIVEFVTRPLGAVTTHTLQLQVDNVAPTLDVNGPTATLPGDLVVFSVVASDVSPVDMAKGLIIAVDWQSDGVIDQVVVGSTAQLTHQFTRPGEYVATFTVTDKDGDSTTVTQLITVQTAQQQIDAIEAHVQQLIASGDLPKHKGKALLAQLEQVTKKLDRGNSRPAVNMLLAVEHQIRSLVRKDILTKSEGAELTSMLHDAIDAAQLVKHAKPVKHCGPKHK